MFGGYWLLRESYTSYEDNVRVIWLLRESYISYKDNVRVILATPGVIRLL